MPQDPDLPTAARAARFEVVAALVLEPLQRYLRRRAADADADDALADVMLVCWRRLDDVPAGAELAWCYGVARRCLANQRRAAGRQARLAGKLAAVEPADVPVAGEPASGDPALAAALDLLSDADRELLQLWAWEGLEPRELAVVLGTTANAVSIRLHRARRRLGDLLGAPDPSGRKGGATAGQAGVSTTKEEGP